MFKRIFLNENIRILDKISLEYVALGLINNMSASVQIMAWCRSGDTHFLTNADPVHRRIYAAPGGDELVPFVFLLVP